MGEAATALLQELCDAGLVCVCVCVGLTASCSIAFEASRIEVAVEKLWSIHIKRSKQSKP